MSVEIFCHSNLHPHFTQITSARRCFAVLLLSVSQSFFQVSVIADLKYLPENCSREFCIIFRKQQEQLEAAAIMNF